MCKAFIELLIELLGCLYSRCEAFIEFHIEFLGCLYSRCEAFIELLGCLYSRSEAVIGCLAVLAWPDQGYIKTNKIEREKSTGAHFNLSGHTVANLAATII